MPSPMALNDFLRKFKRLDVTFDRRRGSHLFMTRRVGKVTKVYTVAVQGGKRVLPVYVDKARRALWLTPEHGVSDAYFDSL